MLEGMKSESARLLDKLTKIRTRLDNTAQFGALASSDVIQTIAVSDKIAAELKEILIILHTTTTTELIESKTHALKVNFEMVGAAEEIINLQSDIIKHLALKEKTKKPTTGWNFFKEYKGPLSFIMVMMIMWLLYVLSPVAMDKIFHSVPVLAKGLL